MNCEKVSYLVEKRVYDKLSFFDKFQVWFHKGICKHCKNYEKDSLVLGRLLHKLAKISEPNRILDKVEKERLKEALRNSNSPN